MGGKRKELRKKGKKKKEKRKKKKEKKKANIKSPMEIERVRERDTCVRQNVFAILWGTWWCSTSTKFLTFQFFILLW